jgi:hypothetical protein
MPERFQNTLRSFFSRFRKSEADSEDLAKQSGLDVTDQKDRTDADIFGCECGVKGCECGVKEGQLHDWGCRWEYCPFCQIQFVAGCDCVYELLGLKSRNNSPDFDQLPQQTYEKGLTEEQEANWFRLCDAKGRIPFLYQPQLCARCGCEWPDLFVVQNKVWQYYTYPIFHEAILCFACFNLIKQQVDKHLKRPAWLPSEEEIEEYVQAWRKGDKETLMRLEPKR